MEIISCPEARKKGLSRFFTGKPCPRGHICERRVSGYACIKCVSEKRKEKLFAKKLANNQVPFLNPKLYFPTPKLPIDLAKEKGLKWYITGIPCANDHCCDRQVANQRCRACGNSRNKANFDQWYAKGGREKVIANAKRWVSENKEKRKIIAREWNREACKDPKYVEHKNKLRREGNRLELHKKRMKEDLGYRTEVKLRQYIRESIKRQSARKQSKFKKLLGIEIDQFIKHIESQFTIEMSWDNRGYETWHIDHIRPCESFDLSDKEQQLVCFNYRNQQPLSAKENLKKRDIYTAEDEKKWVEHMRKSGYEGELFTLYLYH